MHRQTKDITTICQERIQLLSQLRSKKRDERLNNNRYFNFSGYNTFHNLDLIKDCVLNTEMNFIIKNIITDNFGNDSYIIIYYFNGIHIKQIYNYIELFNLNLESYESVIIFIPYNQDPMIVNNETDFRNAISSFRVKRLGIKRYNYYIEFERIYDIIINEEITKYINEKYFIPWCPTHSFVIYPKLSNMNEFCVSPCYSFEFTVKDIRELFNRCNECEIYFIDYNRKDETGKKYTIKSMDDYYNLIYYIHYECME